MYLLMFVIGTVGFIAMRMFMGNISFTLDESGSFSITDLDPSRRDPDYENISESGDYRVVRYISETGDRKTVSYYVECAKDDVKIPLGVCKRVAGCRHIHTAAFTDKNYDHIKWGTQKINGKTTEVLYVEGIMRENPYLIKKIDSESSSSSSTSSTSSTSSSNSSSTSSSTETAE